MNAAPMNTEPMNTEPMNTKELRKHVSGFWDRQILPTLSEYITIPNESTSFDKDLTGVFRDNPLPVLAVFGRHDMSHPIGYAEMWKKEFPNARILIFEDSSHNIFASEPERFFEELKAFVSGLN